MYQVEKNTSNKMNENRTITVPNTFITEKRLHFTAEKFIHSKWRRVEKWRQVGVAYMCTVDRDKG